jgi:hypothetical protein
MWSCAVCAEMEDSGRCRDLRCYRYMFLNTLPHSSSWDGHLAERRLGVVTAQPTCSLPDVLLPAKGCAADLCTFAWDQAPRPGVCTGSHASCSFLCWRRQADSLFLTLRPYPGIGLTTINGVAEIQPST